MEDYIIKVRIERDHGTSISVKIDPEKTEIEAVEPYSHIGIQADFDYSHRSNIVEQQIGMNPDDILVGNKTGIRSFYNWKLFYGDDDADLSRDLSNSYSGARPLEDAHSEAMKFVEEIDKALINQGSTHHFS